MIRKVIDYMREDSFEVRIEDGYVCVMNYTDIHYMEEEKISLAYSSGTLLIQGKKLVVVKLLDNEILIKGNFSNLEFRRNHE